MNVQPKANLVTLKKNEGQIKKLLFDLVLNPRLRAIQWSNWKYH